MQLFLKTYFRFILCRSAGGFLKKANGNVKQKKMSNLYKLLIYPFHFILLAPFCRCTSTERRANI